MANTSILSLLLDHPSAFGSFDSLFVTEPHLTSYAQTNMSKFDIDTASLHTAP